MIKLDPRLDGYLKGEIKPATRASRASCAFLCAWPSRQLFGEAARLYEQAFALEPARASDLRLGYRYHAAGCAARAASGKGRDRSNPAERTHCRESSRVVTSRSGDPARTNSHGKPEQASDARIKLRYWQNDPDLAGVATSEL